jgi:hypothetical protein
VFLSISVGRSFCSLCLGMGYDPSSIAFRQEEDG